MTKLFAALGVVAVGVVALCIFAKKRELNVTDEDIEHIVGEE